MSTKVTLSHSDKYHLYEECFDTKSIVNLRIDNPVGLKVDMWEASEGSATVVILIEMWRHIVEGWLKTQWAQNPEWDNSDNWDGNTSERIAEQTAWLEEIATRNKEEDEKASKKKITKTKLNETDHHIHHIICECIDHAHTVRFLHFEPIDDWDNEIYISSYLSTEPNIIKRIWYGIRYIFGYRSRYGEFGETSMNMDQATKLRDYLTEFTEGSKND